MNNTGHNLPETFGDDLLPLFGSATGNAPLIIAGPCSAESAVSVLECAKALQRFGIRYFRAGLWKPRTRPGAFEGVGDRGLSWLRKVKTVTGMKVLTEVGNAAHTAMAVRAGLDGVWIGARTTANPFAVQEIADELDRLKASDITVLVKNPVNPDIELWIGALERLYKVGIRRLGAVHRGFSSYAPGRWRNPPQWAIPIELHRRLPGMPLLHDPSHCSGKASEVPLLAMQAMKLCFSGLMIEAHISPSEALSDASQQLTPKQVGDLMENLSGFKKRTHGSDAIQTLRDTIDALDSELLQVLSKRMEACRGIGEYKLREGMPVIQPERYASLLGEKIAAGVRMGLNPEFLSRIFAEIHAESVNLQLSLHIPQPDNNS